MPAEAPSMVDWALARSTAARLVKPGPTISADGARAAVAELREAAARAERELGFRAAVGFADGMSAFATDPLRPAP